MRTPLCIRRHSGAHATGAGVPGAAVALAIFSTLAYAEPIRFDNGTHGGPFLFHWPPSAVGLVRLDLTLPAESQSTAVAGPTVVRQRLLSGTRTRLEGDTSDVYLEVDGTGSLLLLEAGDVVSSEAARAATAWVYTGGTSVLPEGIPVYLGVQLSLEAGGAAHYGWIEVERTGPQLDALAWGYETQPGVPIFAGIPEPASLALLALSALLGGRGLRR